MHIFMTLLQKWGIFTALFIIGGFFFISGVAQAATFETVPVTISGNGELTMVLGEVKEVSVTFHNTGDVTWYNDGAGYISLYTYEPKYRSSDFDPGTWLGPDQVKRIVEPVVAPGEVASISFELHAPEAEGEYEEAFLLASEDVSWIDGGLVKFSINVTSEIQESLTVIDSGDVDGGLDAELTILSATKVKASAGSSILLTAGFKNIGETSWSEYSLNEMDVALATASTVSFDHPSWLGSKLAYATDSIAPGETAYVTFALMAPDVNGTHTAEFQFRANGESIEGAIVELPVEVTGGAAAIDDNDDEDINYELDEEPVIRVGLLTVDEETDYETVITSYESDFILEDTQGNLLAELNAGELVTGYYDGGKYYFDRGRGQEVSTYGLRWVPEEENAVMTIVNFDYRETRNGGYANNTYRNILELRYNEHKDRVWVINEISIEQYLYGLAETSDVSPSEYQKALVTAARTYAYANARYDVSDRGEFMHVNAYADDQVYRGYEHEAASPTIVQAVVDTRGSIVTYGGELAITPYFSRSDGRTRSWDEVWAGSKAWCQAVDVPWEDGGTLWGHGIGMSALGALHMANDGYEWDGILHYYYTDIEIEVWWE